MDAMVQLTPAEKRTVFDAKGRGELGVISDNIAEAVGCNSGPIKLLRGVEGRTGGFGEAHIEANSSRMKQLEGVGFTKVVNYARFIADNLSMVGLQADGRIVVITEKDQTFHHLICQWDDQLSIWSVTTAIPKRNMRNVNVLWSR